MGEYLSTPKKDKDSTDGQNAIVIYFLSLLTIIN